MIFYLIMGILGFLILMGIPLFRDLLRGLIGSWLNPGLMKALEIWSTWILWLLKTMVRSHWILVLNLISPHSAIYPTIEQPINPDKGG